jgi:hypothetical protein
MMSVVGLNTSNLDSKRGRDSSYSDFLATHLQVFIDATDPLEADSWLHTMKFKFGLLHYIEY